MTAAGDLDVATLVAKRRAELGLSLRQVAERSGGLISHGRLGEIEQGKTTADGVSDRLLEGIAIGLDVPLVKVRRAAGITSQLGPFRLPARAGRLNQREREAVMAVVDALLAARRGS